MTGLIGQMLRFGAVGLVNTCIGLGAIWALMYFAKTPPAVANILGYALGLSVSFALNKAWTFKSGLSATGVLPKYIGLALVCYAANLGVMLSATQFAYVNPYIAQIFGIAVYTISLFAGCRWLVFAPRNIGRDIV